MKGSGEICEIPGRWNEPLGGCLDEALMREKQLSKVTPKFLT